MLFMINFDKKESEAEDENLKQKNFPKKVSATLATSATILGEQEIDGCCGGDYMSTTSATLVSQNSYTESQAQQGLQRSVANVANVAGKNYKKKIFIRILVFYVQRTSLNL